MRDMYIEDVANYEGKEVRIRGWLYNSRSSGGIHFVIIRDGTGYIQGVVRQDRVPPEVFRTAGSTPQESSIVLHGKVKKEPRSPYGYELHVKGMEVLQICEAYPITPKAHGTGFLMDHRHLWFRSSRQHAILRIRSELCQACRDFFHDRGFVLIDSPILTPTACEGTTTLFSTDYFGKVAYLTQSGQLYLEPACMAFGKVYCFGPTFRAEKSKTRRHLNEFWMIEPEVAFADLEDIIRLGEEFVTYLVQRVLEERQWELELLERDTAPLERVSPPFPRISYDDAVALLKENGADIGWGEDFGGDQETILSTAFEKPVVIHRFPTTMKAFYMEPDPEREELALAMDVLAPEGYGEIIGGSQRIEDYELLRQRLDDEGLPHEAFQWYLDVRKYGSARHSGFGLGIERVVGWICGVRHLRETIPYPRTLNRLYP